MSTIQVATLRKKLDKIEDDTVYKRLSDVQFTPEGLVFQDSGEVREIDEMGYQKLGNYFGVNKAYLKKCPPDLAAMNLEYWRQKYPDAETRFYFWNDQLEAVTDADKQVVSPKQTLTSLSRVLRPNDEVADARIEPDNFFADFIFADSKIEVPGHGTELRPDNDVTHGGLRLRQYNNTSEPIVLETYLHRLVCTNGMAVYNPLNRVALKGNTVEDVLLEVEEKAQEIFSGLESYLEKYRESSTIPVEGNIQTLVRQLGRERGLSEKVIVRAEEMSLDLTEGEATIYDVTQVFTQLANLTNSFRAKKQLQYLGADLSFNHEEVLHRCNNCEKLL